MSVSHSHTQLSPLAWQREADRLRAMAHRAANLGGDHMDSTVARLVKQARAAQELAKRDLAKGA